MEIKLPVLKFQKEYFILLLPLFFVLHVYKENYALVTLQDAYQSFLIYLLIILLISLVFFIFFRSWRKGAVFAFLVMSYHFFFGALHDSAKSLFGEIFLIKYVLILPVTFIAFILLILVLKKSKKKINRFTTYINVLLVLLISIDAAELAILRSKLKDQIVHKLRPDFVNCDSCARPDIYFITADEYAGHQELQDIFHFDNSEFENALRTRGFYVVPNSKSNYNYTPYSMGSLLNMDYLEGVQTNGDSKDLNMAYQKINENTLVVFLHNFNYEIKNYSIFRFAGQRPFVNSVFGVFGRELIHSQTFFGRIDRDIRFNLITRWKFKSEMKKFTRNEISYSEASIKKTMDESALKTNNPRFIYMHVLMPHYPYFFDKAGHPNKPDILFEEYKFDQKSYIDYLQYCNKRFLELIDGILSHSQKPPVIVFMGDHGFRYFKTPVDHKYYFMNLNSVFLPSGDYSKFYEGMSNVNQFRVLLNSQFGQKLPLLKDSTIFLKDRLP